MAWGYELRKPGHLIRQTLCSIQEPLDVANDLASLSLRWEVGAFC